VTDQQAWREVILELLGTWPGRLDEVSATAYVHSLIGRGATDPHVVLTVLRAHVSEHPPSASIVAAAALRHGQPDPPTFDELLAFVARTLATRTEYGSDDSAAYVEHVAEHLGEAAARWVAGVGVKGLREVPDPRYTLDKGQQIRLRDHERGYAETVAEWRRDPRPRAVEEARRRDALETFRGAGPLNAQIAGRLEPGQ
jgi:hypothetical protein